MFVLCLQALGLCSCFIIYSLINQIHITSVKNPSGTDTMQFRDWGFPGGTVVKNPPASEGNAGDAGSILGLGRSPGGGHGRPLQYSCLRNPMDREA